MREREVLRMRMVDLIKKKRDGYAFTEEEINFLIDGYVSGEIPDYQVSALLMAILWRGMTDRELVVLTDAMARSGDMVDLSGISGIKVDKHSTGGVGDKTTLIACPIAAACGVKIAKMSGRGLGHTGGTVDKLEAIPGYRTSITRAEFFDIVNQCGISVIGQSGNLAPADKKLYALRDVTATVESIPLIAASIMSKKLAAGSDCILLDVKVGSGAFMKTVEDAAALAEKMIAIGEGAGRKVMALITNMDLPLGACIGNSLEVWEAVQTLKGEGPEDLTRICVELAARMLQLAGKGSVDECRKMAKAAIHDGSAFEAFVTMVKAQGGDISYLLEAEKLCSAAYSYEVKAEESGYMIHMDTEECGMAACMLGAGRERKDSEIDYSAGIVLKKKTGDQVEAGETVAVLYASDEQRFAAAAERFLASIQIEKQKGELLPLILAEVTADGIVLK